VLQDEVKKMERVVESEQKATEIKIEFEEEEEELEFIVPWADEEMKASSSGNQSLYGKTIGGVIAIVALLIVPLVSLSGMVILVLFAEIYLVDWTYGKVKQLRGNGSTPARISGSQGSASQVERKNPRNGPKDQFVK